MRRKVSGKTKAIVTDGLGHLHAEMDAGARAAPASYTVRRTAEDWLESELTGRAVKTIRKNKVCSSRSSLWSALRGYAT
jgi:hypothetical protein